MRGVHFDRNLRAAENTRRLQDMDAIQPETERGRAPLAIPGSISGTPIALQLAAHYPSPLDFVTRVHQRDLWHDGRGNGYISLGNNHVRIGSAAWSDWMRSTWYYAHLKSITDTHFNSTTNTIAALASRGPRFSIYNRVARYGGKIFIDLVNDSFEVVEIAQTGWRIITDPPIKFVRGPDAAALPTPKRGGTLHDLRTFVNLPNDEFVKYIAATLDALKGHGDYMVNVTSGEQGSGKTTLERLAVRLVDPRHVRDTGDTSDIPGPPKDDYDLAAAACNSHLVAFDNVSTITDALSDSLCRVSTGGGITKRKLYTDSDLVRLSYCNPLWLNGINPCVKRPDLIDRCAFLRAQRVRNPIPISTLLVKFESARPRLLGALYDTLAAGLRHEISGPRVGRVNLPRMAASGAWAFHCLTAIGWPYELWLAGIKAGQAPAQYPV